MSLTPPKPGKLIAFLVFFLILLFAFFVRWQTFWLPHWQGDQHQYITLAMKLSRVGPKAYNLKDVDIRFQTLPTDESVRLAYPELKPKDSGGDMMQMYKSIGMEYYDMPTFYKAPLLPAILAFTHQLFCQPAQPFVVVSSNLGRDAARLRPELFFQAQFWAVIVPLASNLCVILLVFVMGLRMFGVRPAIYAMAIMAMNPISILTSNRILTEDLATLLGTLSLGGFFYFFRKKIRLGVWFSGVVMGYAVLTNQKMILLIPGLWVFTILTGERPLNDARNWLRIVFNAEFLLYGLGILCVSAWWFKWMIDVYGNPLYSPSTKFASKQDVSGWITLVQTRAPSFIFYTFGLSVICPPLLAALASVKRLILEIRDSVLRRGGRYFVLFLWLWILPVFIFQMTHKGAEYRYLMPALPALTVLAGLYLNKLRGWINSRFVQPYYGDLAVCAVLVASAVWAAPLGLDPVFTERFLIMVPF